MTIQFYSEELDYVNVKMELADLHSFLFAFLQACLRADAENYRLLRPVLHELMAKYPASAERLAAEKLDR